MEKVILKEIYELFEVDYDQCDCMDDVLEMIKEDCFSIEEDRKLSVGAKKGNRYDILITKIQNFFGIFTEDDYEWIEEDNILLDEQIELSNRYLNYYSKILDIINVENYRDIYKLICFMMMNYASVFEYFEKNRDSINLASRGIGFICSDELCDNRGEFEELFNSEYNRISLIKPVQKTK